MNGNNHQPDPPIRELRQRWPFFSEGELKWLLSPKRPGAHPDFNEDMEASKVENECPGPLPSESPVACPQVEECTDVDVRSSFAFMYDKKREEQYSDFGYSLGPRSLVFQDENTVQNENPFHMNPFCNGLDPMQEEAPIVFNEEKRAGEEVECSSEETNNVEYFTPLKECEDQEEFSQNHSGVDHSGEKVEEEEEEEQPVLNSAVKRMSFALEDGKKLPKFSPGVDGGL